MSRLQRLGLTKSFHQTALQLVNSMLKLNKMKKLINILLLLIFISSLLAEESEQSKPTKEEINNKSNSWLKTKSFEDFQWLKDNVLEKGLSKESVIKYLGKPISIDNTKEYTLFWYKKIDINKKEFYACYLAIDLNNKLLWVTAKGVE